MPWLGSAPAYGDAENENQNLLVRQAKCCGCAKGNATWACPCVQSVVVLAPVLWVAPDLDPLIGPDHMTNDVVRVAPRPSTGGDAQRRWGCHRPICQAEAHLACTGTMHNPYYSHQR